MKLTKFLIPDPVGTRYIYKRMDIVDKYYSEARPRGEDKSEEFGRIEDIHDETALDGLYGPESMLDEGSLVDPKKLLNKVESLLDDGSFDTEKSRKTLSRVIVDSRTLIEEELGIEMPKFFLQELQALYGAIGLNPKKLRHQLEDFVGKAQISNGKMTRYTPWICAFLKAASAGLMYHQSPELQELEPKTKKFEKWFSVRGQFDAKKAKENGSPFIHSNVGESFPVVKYYTRAKTKMSTFAKLARKPGDSARTLVQDGIGARLVVDEKYMEAAEKWLIEGVGMEPKKKNNSSRSKQKDKDTYLIGKTPDGDIFEVQLSTTKNIRKGESGVSHPRIYKQKQKLLLQARLFGSISKKNFEDAIKQVAEETGTKAEIIRSDYLRYFFSNRENHGPKTVRYYSFEHVGRMFNSPFMPDIIKSEMCARLDIKSARIPYVITLSDLEWAEIFDTFCFPEKRLENTEIQASIIRFLEEDKATSGLPRTILASLKILHRAIKGGKPAEIMERDDWIFLFKNRDFSNPEDINQQKEVIKYLKSTKELSFLCTCLETKHEANRAIG